MKRFFIRMLIAFSALVVMAVAYGASTLARARQGLPVWDGTVALAGLGSDVTIRRDQTGTPFIEASTERDLYFAQGFVHAQDRFWQMAIGRQATLGRLSEWFGGLTLNADRSTRMWGWAHQARRSLEALPRDDRALLEAYAEGVNAWLDSPVYRRPPEMVVLHVHPERWRPEDSFLVAYAMHRTLASPGMEWDRGFLESTGAPSVAAEILNDTSILAPPIISTVPGDAIRQATAAFKDRAFSDNWTLAGEHTVSGKPLMANDPQLPIGLPGTWQLQQLTLGGRRMAGATLPGAPGIVVGHNGSVAWGITNAQIDAFDLAYLELDPDDPSRYRRGPTGAWLDFEERPEDIRVRFGRDRVETVRSTPYGVVWPLGLASALLQGSTNRTFEVRDLAVDLPTTAPISFMRMGRARTVEEGIEAIEGVTSPAVNLSLADTAGTIGYVMTGRIPDRPKAHATTAGFAPEDANEWEYLPFEDNPRVVAPSSGRIVTANQRIVGDEFPHYLTDMWAPPYRAWRVHELLDTRSRHDPSSFVTMQMDPLSPVARELVPLMLELDSVPEADRLIVDVLREWDYRFTPDSPAPMVWLTWVDALRRTMLEDETGPLRAGWAAVLYTPMIRALSGERPEWCDDRRTEEAETCDELLRGSLSVTRQAVDDAFGSDPVQWRWEDVARFDIPHLGFATLPFLGKRFSRDTPIPGGPESLFTNAVDPGGAPRFTATYFNSSFQAVYDLSDLDASLFMSAAGPSGHFASPFYDNRSTAWASGERITLSPHDLVSTATLTLTAR